MTKRRTHSYGVVIEGGEAPGYSAYVPDLPGCIGAGDTLEEAIRDIREAVAAHVAWLRADREPVPDGTEVVPVDIPNAFVTFVEVEVPDADEAASG